MQQHIAQLLMRSGGNPAGPQAPMPQQRPAMQPHGQPGARPAMSEQRKGPGLARARAAALMRPQPGQGDAGGEG